MALSDDLSKLTTRTKEAEDRAAAAQEKARADLEADRDNARAVGQQQAEELRERAEENKGRISDIQITPKAEVKQYWLGKTVIHSDHRFTYEEAQTTIEEKTGLYADEILILNDIASVSERSVLIMAPSIFLHRKYVLSWMKKGTPWGS